MKTTFTVMCHLSPGVLWALDTYDTELEARARGIEATRAGDKGVRVVKVTQETIWRAPE